MIIYQNDLQTFSNDVLKGVIASEITACFQKRGLNHHNDAELRSWQNSLMVMNNVLCNNSGIDQAVQIAIEYQIPLTSKRIDMLIAGKDSEDKSNVIIIELKQWERCNTSSKTDIVETILGGTKRAVVHPSYQAYSYAKAIENFNESVRDKKINLYPCAFLHNYIDDAVPMIKHPKYQEIIDVAPLFLRKDQVALREFIKKYVKYPDRNNEILYAIENGKIKPSVALQDAVAELLGGNEVFTMIDEQKVAFATISEVVAESIGKDEKHTLIIEGGPGTGKSVIAVNLLANLIREGYNVQYVTKNAAPRNVFITQLINGNYRKRYVENLFKGSGVFIETPPNTFDCLLVDESHRLNMKSGIFMNKGENQIKEIINAAKISVFFIDEDQVVTAKDAGSVAAIKRACKELGSIVHHENDFKLVSQFRCNGSDGYLAFLDNLLGIKATANIDLADIDYDVRVFSDPNEMRNELRKLNKNNKARILAGYCYDWISKNNSSLYDIKLKNGFQAQWNFSSTSTWAIDEDSFEQVGCIHTSQGLEFDYCGVIIGADLYYDNGVKTDFKRRAKTDQSLHGIKGDYALADRIIRNTYKTLLSRGQKGCFIYCEDEKLRNYIMTKRSSK
ncbi:MAG: DUF2075 domain-containing protein [Erysipelotrichaceae bacterium]|nr:DUF2075 domain-containing protein [Erysipelotrichaceae bacterium]